MSLFDRALGAHATAVKSQGLHKTRIPSLPAGIRAVWQPLDDPSALSVFIKHVNGTAPDDNGKALATLLARSIVRFEATDDDPEDPDAVWEIVEDDDGPLKFDRRMERRLRAAGHELGEGAYEVAVTLCGGVAGLLTLASTVGSWQLTAANRIAEVTEGKLAAQPQTPATAPPSE